MAGKKARDPKAALTKQVQTDLANQLKLQRDANGLSAKGIKTLVQSNYLITDLLKEVINSDDIDMSDHLIPKHRDGSINIEKTDALYNNIAAFYDRYIESNWQQFIDDNPGHSDSWYADRLDAYTDAGALHNGFSGMLTAVMEDLSDEDKGEIIEKYNLDAEKGYLRSLALVVFEKRRQLANEKDPNGNDLSKKRTLVNDLRNRNHLGVFEHLSNRNADGKWKSAAEWKKASENDANFKTYMEQQSELKKSETKMTHRNKLFANYRFIKSADFSYITDEALKKTLAEKTGNGFYHYNQNDSHISAEEYQENKALFSRLDKLQRDVKAAKPWFNWLRPSKKYAALKQSVDDLRRALQKGDTTKNRSALRDAYAAVENARSVYAEKYPQRSRTLMADLHNFHQSQIERLDQRTAEYQETRALLDTHCQALRNEQARTMHPEQHAAHRRNLSILTMLGENYRQKSLNFKPAPFSLADAIAHPEKYENERTAALRDWDAGVKQAEPDILQCGDLRLKVEYIQTALETIDLEKEALRYLGIEETDKEKTAALLQDPDNQAKLQAFYEAAAEVVALYEGDTFKAIRYDLEHDTVGRILDDPDTGIRKFKDSLQALTHPEKERISLHEINARSSTVSLGRKSASRKSELSRSNTSISNKK